MSKFDIEHLSFVYREFADILGIEAALKIYETFKGLQVNFPTRLLCNEHVRTCIKTEYNGNNLKELARKYDYSERWIRKMLNDDID